MSSYSSISSRLQCPASMAEHAHNSLNFEDAIMRRQMYSLLLGIVFSGLAGCDVSKPATTPSGPTPVASPTPGIGGVPASQGNVGPSSPTSKESLSPTIDKPPREAFERSVEKSKYTNVSLTEHPDGTYTGTATSVRNPNVQARVTITPRPASNDWWMKIEDSSGGTSEMWIKPK